MVALKQTQASLIAEGGCHRLSETGRLQAQVHILSRVLLILLPWTVRATWYGWYVVQNQLSITEPGSQGNPGHCCISTPGCSKRRDGSFAWWL